VFDWLATIDGNNSLKRWASSSYGTDAREDSRQAHSDYWIDQIAVNKFQNDVRAHAVCNFHIVRYNTAIIIIV
jgi:hypothetical protein